MADYIKGLFGGPKAAQSPIPAAHDADFADFAGAPDPSPASISPVTAAHISPTPAPFGGRPGVPYTKWYRVWERTSAADFMQEAFILPFIILIVLVHLWGTRTNRRKAKAWMRAHAPVLQQEFAVVGFGGRRAPGADDTLMKEKAGNEFVTYATGRQNVAFVDVKLSLLKRYNPLSQYSEMVLGFFFDSLNAPVERMEATSYCFDGKESQLVPSMGGAETKSAPNSTFDGFVWAIVHKNSMRRLRDDRYDISLTSTKDNPKLPAWATVMSEAAEITDALLTPELISAVEKAGEALEALIVTDQPLEQPKKLDETVPKKRITLSLHLPSSSTASAYDSTLPLFHYFLRMPDQLAAHAHFRPEAMRKVRATREEEIRKIRRVDEDEKAEERKLKSDKERKEKRDQLLKGMSAKEQEKYLAKERAKTQRKSEKARTMKG
ncbi:hypothetical protein W97_04831 [Coniosporium apollinis CBS 100218]|uniref:DUF1682 domain-containing protein n=1 Tax=Coniosporium apollinis (strain CBS 100218) TaxID=1168221 RepID=R7YUU0_CONA1|nr:uncharacterized protein W97_04831 [Coniosporium apollinis CBS 100218]EON65593.1 hypothetical protein W97_04831 [Coniosporium apollinis CBS 100218]